MKTDQKPTHTPTPWEIKDKTTHSTLWHLGEHLGDIVNHRDAALVVRAVNAYQPMLDALLAFKKYAESNYSGDGMKALDLAEQAISKAQGESK